MELQSAVLLLALIGAVADWQYHRAGGKQSSRKDRLLFWSVVLVVGGAIAVTDYMGGDPRGILGIAAADLIIWLFGAWELGRWRMRRKYPLQQKADAAGISK